jgi:hypothetical protein
MSNGKNGEARSTVAVASEHLNHEMTLSMAGSEHVNLTAKTIHPTKLDPVNIQKFTNVSKSISSQEASAPASSMRAQPGSSNSNS